MRDDRPGQVTKKLWLPRFAERQKNLRPGMGITHTLFIGLLRQTNTVQNALWCSPASISRRSWKVAISCVRQSRQLTLGRMTSNHRAQLCVCLYLFYTHSLGDHICLRSKPSCCVDSTRDRTVSCMSGHVSCISPWSNQMDSGAWEPGVLLLSLAARKSTAIPSQHKCYRTTLQCFKNTHRSLMW